MEKIINEASVINRFSAPKFHDYVSSVVLDSDYELNTYWATDDVTAPRIFKYLGKAGMYLCFRECAVKRSGKYFAPIAGKYIGLPELRGDIAKDGARVYDDAKRDYIFLRPLIRARKIDGATTANSFPKWKKNATVDVSDTNGKLTDVFDVISRSGNVVTLKHRIKNTGEEPWTTVVEIEPSMKHPEGIVRIPHDGVVMVGTYGGQIHPKKRRPATRDELINAWLY